MFIVRVVPIARGVFTNELSFFSREPVAEGALITAQVRGKTIPGIVIASTEARAEKAGIRRAGFSLKKIDATNAKKALLPSFISSIHDTALWHGAHESTVLAALTSSVILTAPAKLTEAPAETVRGNTRAEVVALQAEKEERVRVYKNLAREALARSASVLLIAPTVIEAETLAAALMRGIEEQLILFTGDLPKKKLIEAWNRAATDPKPLLIVGTPMALSLPRGDVDTIIVERESARAYRGAARPYVDFRRAAEYAAREKGARCILADFPLRVETRYRIDTGASEELSRAQIRAGGAVHIVDTRTKDVMATTKSGTSRRTFRAISEESLAAIERETARGGKVIIFSPRKGLAPLTVCNDCGTPVSDKETGTPMVLHRGADGKNVFLSHRSGALLPAETPCENCGGWNLITLGAGIERVEDELKKALPKISLTVMTKETHPTHARAKKATEDFFASRSSVLLGTERMLPYLTHPVELAAAVSADTLLSLPAWRAQEHALATLCYVAERAELECIIETRKPEHPVLQTLAAGTPLDFYRADIAERERYGYPPFATFIGLSWRGPKIAVEKMRLFIKEHLSDIDLVGPLPAISEGKNAWSARAVIRVPKGAWPDETLAARLKALPPGIAITIDPDEIA